MANNIKDLDKNYVKIKEILSNRYEEVGGYDFYRYLFPNNQNEGVEWQQFNGQFL